MSVCYAHITNGQEYGRWVYRTNNHTPHMLYGHWLKEEMRL